TWPASSARMAAAIALPSISFADTNRSLNVGSRVPLAPPARQRNPRQIGMHGQSPWHPQRHVEFPVCARVESDLDIRYCAPAFTDVVFVFAGLSVGGGSVANCGSEGTLLCSLVSAACTTSAGSANDSVRPARATFSPTAAPSRSTTGPPQSSGDRTVS